MPAAEHWKILLLNKIDEGGLSCFSKDNYRWDEREKNPHAILLRSADLHAYALNPALLAVARAGAGTNNIPITVLSKKGVPVFNTPGANANAVKELVLAALIVGIRNLVPALQYVETLPLDDSRAKKVEDGKKQFVGGEVMGRTLGVVGLGKIGCLVANTALDLGMNVVGFDPGITVDAAWNLSSQVRRASSLEKLLHTSDFITLHVPLTTQTKHIINSKTLQLLSAKALLLNFSREDVVDEKAVIEALDAGRLALYICDFPSRALAGHSKAVTFLHLGASTEEAERNCASMAVNQLRAYLEDGQITNSVNFPSVHLPRESNFRVAVANANVPNMLGQISTSMAAAGINIHNMINKSQGDIAYTLVDVDSPVNGVLLNELKKISGVLSVRYLPKHG